MKRYRYGFKLCIPYTKSAIEIQVNQMAVFAALWKMYSPYVFALEEHLVTNMEICINFVSGYIILSRNNVKKEISLEKENVIGQIGSLIRWILEIEYPWNLFHGAAVCIQGKTLVFLGASGTGKTTLMTYLANVCSDVTYLSEDMLIINSRQCSICPYPRPLHLRSGGKKVLEEHHIKTIQMEKVAYGNYERYLVEQPIVTKDIFQIDCLVKLERKPYKVESILKKVEKEKFEILLANSFLPANVKNNTISSVQLSSMLPMYSIQYYSIDDMVKILYSVVEDLRLAQEGELCRKIF